MKKTVLVLGCLLAIGFSSVSCNRDDSTPEAQVTPTPPTPPTPPTKPTATVIGEADLPTTTKGILKLILKSKVNPDGSNNGSIDDTERYVGEQVTYAKISPADAQNGAVYQAALGNGVKLGFREDGSWAYADGNGTPLKASIWSLLPSGVDGAVRAISGTAITEITKWEKSVADVYTITLKNGDVKKYKEDGKVAP